MTAPYVDTLDAADVKWAGQNFFNGTATGVLQAEEVGSAGVVEVRGSEAVLLFFG